MTIKSSSMAEYDEPEGTWGPSAELGELIEEATKKFFRETVKNIEAEITWGEMSVTINGTVARWEMAALFDDLFRELDERPQDLEDTVKDLLPVLKAAVAELERRQANQPAAQAGA